MITAPYNFVPLSSKVFFPDWADKVSQDIPFGDGEDGIIELTIKNVTPLFTKNGSKKVDKEEYSSHIVAEDGSKRYFIPGTTLKGCFRSVMEILSFAKMQMYDDDSFGIPREFDTRKADNKYYMQFMKDVRCGWLQKVGEEYMLSECAAGLVDIKHGEIKAEFPKFNIGREHKSAEIKQNSFGNGTELYPIYYRDNETYRIVCTGYMKGKEREYLFSENQYEPIKVDKEIVKSFESVHRNTEYYGGKNGKGGFLKSRLHRGEPIPVFFTSKNGVVAAMGITRMFRYPYPISVKNAVNNSYSNSIDLKKKDLPETIFGYTDGKKSLKGRVSFMHAFADGNIDDNSLVEFSGVLGLPSSTYYPLYLKQDGTAYKTFKDSNAEIAGRKRYRITKDGSYFDLQTGNDNEKIKICLRAIPSGHTFKTRIVLHNLRAVEIGALISSITMNGTSNTYHNIGMAKSFGLGKIECEISLNGLKKSASEYIRAFEFELASAGINLAEETSLDKLVQIASPTHTEEEMKFMSLAQYRDEKKGNSILKEIPKKINTEMSLQELYNAKNAKQEAIGHAKMEAQRKELEQMQKKLEEDAANEKAEKAKKDEENRAKKLEKYSITFADMLVMDEYVSSNLLQWSKIEGHAIGVEEYALLVAHLKSLDKNDRKKVMKKRDDFTKALGKALSEKLYKEKDMR